MADIQDTIGNLPMPLRLSADDQPEPETPLRLVYQTHAGEVELIESKDGVDSIEVVEEIVRDVMTNHYFKVLPIVAIKVRPRVLFDLNEQRLTIALARIHSTRMKKTLEEMIFERKT